MRPSLKTLIGPEMAPDTALPRFPSRPRREQPERTRLNPSPGLIVMPQIGNTVSPVGASARRASEPPATRSGERAGSVFRVRHPYRAQAFMRARRDVEPAAMVPARSPTWPRAEQPRVEPPLAAFSNPPGADSVARCSRSTPWVACNAASNSVGSTSADGRGTRRPGGRAGQQRTLRRRHRGRTPGQAVRFSCPQVGRPSPRTGPGRSLGSGRPPRLRNPDVAASGISRVVQSAERAGLRQ